MSKLPHDLPAGTYEWIERIGGGTITRLVRHVARREAWIVDVTRPDGSVLEAFLRVQREDGGVDPRRLERETRIVQALGRTNVPVTAVHAWNPELRATLFARDPGRSDIDKLTDARQQRAVMEDFMRVVARMHALDLDSLGIDDVMTRRPRNAREAALDEVDVIVNQWQGFLADYRDPLLSYSLDWLRRFAPEKVARISLIQGDTGPVNFMFQGDRVSSVIDWELGHWGDPMEDLGNIVVREFWNPSGGLTGLFELYARESGIPYDRFAAQYYAVHQNVRGMIPIHAVCKHAHPRESLAWYLCYRYAGDRSTCEMLAQAMEIPIERPAVPEGVGEPDVLAESALYAQANDVGPAVGDAFARSRARDVATLVACMDRRRRYGRAIDAIEQDEIGALLGRRPADAEEGVRLLDEAIRARKLPDEKLVPYLTRRSYREEWLYSPSVELYPARNWAALD
ncbi:MAG: phosphotransferase family protein [Deltaproteobacteria bacterium]|nr:phosphotransferase family protein [Deltaproteobacteria bacterium]